MTTMGGPNTELYNRGREQERQDNRFSNSLIDHTLLKASASQRDIERLCHESVEYGFHSVCVNPYWVKTCQRSLEGSEIRVCSVVGFPLGCLPTKVKLQEAQRCRDDGANELDIVVSNPLVTQGRWDLLEAELDILRTEFKPLVLKLILETDLRTSEEISKLTKMALDAKWDFVKTSTGTLGAGATEWDIRLMRQVAGLSMGVKASGGIRNLEIANQMILNGANRLGSSNAIEWCVVTK